MNEQIESSVRARQLPPELDKAFGTLKEADGSYISQEGVNWDFKQQWPFSYSDEYFAGIARLICSFANTRGGLILFGVHDKLRTAGHSKVVPNVDKLESALASLLSDKVTVILRRYAADTSDAVDALLVLPRPDVTMPIRFKRRIERYPENVIWIRESHEVTMAGPRHIPMLYCRSFSGGDDSEGDSGLSGGLPPSPSTVEVRRASHHNRSDIPMAPLLR